MVNNGIIDPVSTLMMLINTMTGYNLEDSGYYQYRWSGHIKSINWTCGFRCQKLPQRWRDKIGDTWVDIRNAIFTKKFAWCSGCICFSLFSLSMICLLIFLIVSHYQAYKETQATILNLSDDSSICQTYWGSKYTCRSKIIVSYQYTNDRQPINCYQGKGTIDFRDETNKAVGFLKANKPGDSIPIYYIVDQPQESYLAEIFKETRAEILIVCLLGSFAFLAMIPISLKIARKCWIED